MKKVIFTLLLVALASSCLIGSCLLGCLGGHKCGRKQERKGCILGHCCIGGKCGSRNQVKDNRCNPKNRDQFPQNRCEQHPPAPSPPAPSPPTPPTPSPPSPPCNYYGGSKPQVHPLPRERPDSNENNCYNNRNRREQSSNEEYPRGTCLKGRDNIHSQSSFENNDSFRQERACDGDFGDFK